MEEQKAQAALDAVRIQQEMQKITRTGRQPGFQKESQEVRKKREDRVSGRSFENSSHKSIISDNSSRTVSGNMMVIPEDDLIVTKDPCFGGVSSMQTS